MDIRLLETKMKIRGLSVSETCRRAGISRSAYYRKRRGTTEFTLEEMLRLTRLLRLSRPGDIFFAE